MEKLETVFLWCIGVVEKAKEIYLRWFPTAGGIFAVVFPWWDLYYNAEKNRKGE